MVFLLLKNLSVNPKNYITQLQNEVHSIIKRKKALSVTCSKYLCENYFKQDSLFSDIYHSVSVDNNDKNIDNFMDKDNQISYHYIC